MNNAEKNADTFTYSIDGNAYVGKDALIDIFLIKWNVARDQVLGSGDFVIELFSQEMACAVEISLLSEEYHALKEQNYLDDCYFSKIVQCFYESNVPKTEAPIFWCGKRYESLEQMAIQMLNGEIGNNAIESLLQSRFLTWYITRIGDSRESIRHFSEIENMSMSYSGVARNSLIYSLLSDDTRSLFSFDRIFDEYFIKTKNIYNSIHRLIGDEVFLGRIYSMGHYSDVKAFLEEGDSRENISRAYLLFERQSTDKESIRKHFCQFGPFSYNTWVKKNIHLYSPIDYLTPEKLKSKTILELLDRLETARIQETADVQTQIIQFESMENDYNSLIEHFQNDPILIGMNVKSEKTIYSNNIDAYFAGVFFGQPVPVGFLRQVGFAELEKVE